MSHRHDHDHGRRHPGPAPEWVALAERFEGGLRTRGSGRGRSRGGGRGHARFGGFEEDFAGRMFGRGARAARGDVRAAILALLDEEPMHGYQIITELTERTGGVWRPSPGSVYPTLQALEDQGLVVAQQADGRRVFSLTPEGRAEAGNAEGPAPWDEVADSADTALHDLKGQLRSFAAAVAQVGRNGNRQELEAVGAILADARRRIYLVLADGAPGAPGESGGSEQAAP